MPNTVDIQRHKLNQSMYQKLKRYIMSKRRRELEEKAQDAHFKKLKREKEERKRQAELDTKNMRSTLDATEVEISLTRRKINDLKTQRGELFKRWKQSGNEEAMLKEKQRSETMSILSNMPATQFGLPNSPSTPSRPSSVVTGSLGPTVQHPHHQLLSVTTTTVNSNNKPAVMSINTPSGSSATQQQHYQQQQKQQQLQQQQQHVHHMQHPQHFMVGKEHTLSHRLTGNSTGSPQSSYHIILPPHASLGKGQPQQQQAYHQQPGILRVTSPIAMATVNNSYSGSIQSMTSVSDSSNIGGSNNNTSTTIGGGHAATMAAVAAAVAAASQRSATGGNDSPHQLLSAYFSALASSACATSTTAVPVTSAALLTTSNGGYHPTDSATITALAAAGLYTNPHHPMLPNVAGGGHFLLPGSPAAYQEAVYSGGHRNSPGEVGLHSSAPSAGRAEDAALVSTASMSQLSAAAAAVVAAFSQQQQAMAKSLRHHSAAANSDHQQVVSSSQLHQASGSATPTTATTTAPSLLPPAPIGYRGSITTGQSAQQIQMQHQQKQQQQQQQHLLSKFTGAVGAQQGGDYTSMRAGGDLNLSHRGSRLSETAAFMAAAAAAAGGNSGNPASPFFTSDLHSGAPTASRSMAQQSPSGASPVAFTTVLAPYASEMSQLNYLTTATLAAAFQQQQQQQQKMITIPTNSSPSPRSRASPASSGGASTTNTPSTNSAGPNSSARRFF